MNNINQVSKKPKDILTQLRYACKHSNDTLLLAKLPIARTAFKLLQKPNVEIHSFELVVLKSDFTIESPYTLGLALTTLIDHCMGNLRSNLDEDTIQAEAYACLYWYVYNGWPNVMRDRYTVAPWLDGRFSQATFYNRLALGITLLAENIGSVLTYYGVKGIKPIKMMDKQPTFSPRELEVLNLTAEGIVESKRIAQRLCVSKTTVDTYWGRVRAKLNARSKTEALVIAERLGIIQLMPGLQKQNIK